MSEIDDIKAAIAQHRRETACCMECANAQREVQECPDGRLWALIGPMTEEPERNVRTASN